MEYIMDLFNKNKIFTVTDSQYWYACAQSHKQIEKYDDYFALITMAANLDHPAAMADLMNDYYKKLHLKQNHSIMLKFYELTKSYPSSANYLGYMHKKGLGVKKSFEQAIKYYESADIENNTNAMVGLGIIISYEDSEFNDSDRGCELLYKAYKQGNINANFYCADAFQYHDFTKYADFTYVNMLQIYEDEIKAGNTGAMCETAKIYYENSDPLVHKTAHRLCKRAGENGNGYGYSLYALNIEEKNTDKAYAFYIKGVELGCHSAHMWICDLAIDYSMYKNNLWDYCISSGNTKLLKMFKDKSDTSDKYIELYTKNIDLTNLNKKLAEKNKKLVEENEKLAERNKILIDENIHLINKIIMIERENIDRKN